MDIEYICDCGDTSSMHSIHDGCSVCDCERNRTEVVIIGQLLSVIEELNDVTDALRNLLEQVNYFDEERCVSCRGHIRFQNLHDWVYSEKYRENHEKDCPIIVPRKILEKK